MGGFFKLDGPFFRYGTLLADIVILTFLWILCSLPIITIGASTSALFYVTTRQISQREGYVSKDFFKSFRTNLVQGTIITIIMLIIAAVLYINIKNIEIMGNFSYLYLGLNLVIMYELTAVSIYIFPMLGRFQMSVKDLFKSSIFIANRHILTTLSCIILMGAIWFLCMFVYPIFLAISGGFYAYISSYMLMKVFKKYRPEIDSDDYEY